MSAAPVAEGVPVSLSPNTAMESGLPLSAGPPSAKKNRNRQRKRKNHGQSTEAAESTENNSNPTQQAAETVQGQNPRTPNSRQYKGQRGGRNGNSDQHGPSPGGSPAYSDQRTPRQPYSAKKGGRGRSGHPNQGHSSPMAVPNQAEYMQQYSAGAHSPGMYHHGQSPARYNGQNPGMYHNSGPHSPYHPYHGPNPQFLNHSPQPGYVPWFHDPRNFDPSLLQQDPRFYPQNHINGNPNGNYNNQQRQRRTSQNAKPKQMFEKHWATEELSHGLKRGELIQGVLRINPKNYEDCYIPHPDGLSDIYISGLRDRNRALNSDIVAVQMYPREQWKVQVDMIDPDEIGITKVLQSLSLASEKPYKTNVKQDKDTQGKGPKSTVDALCSTPTVDAPNVHTPVAAAQENKATPTVGSKTGEKQPQSANKRGQKSGGQATPRKRFTTLKEYASTPEIKRVTKKLFEEKQEGGEDTLKEEEIKERMDAVPIKALVRTGKIVAIIEAKNSRATTGHIKLMNDHNNHTALFLPNDHRMPRMMIPMDNCPKDFHSRPDDHSNVLFIVRLTEWEEHSQYARGKLARSLGEAGEIEPETEGILLSLGVDYEEFTNEALQCLPQNLPWRIPESEFSYRKDLRKECVFTIDPATARDLDDALHVKPIGDGLYEVGVHIADVSFFLEPDTALDHMASERSTSVYLTQKVIPMLPRLLCEELCSLNPGQERLTFSVIWKMTDKGEIVDEWFGRSVIKSCIKMSYDHAQGFIEQPDREWTKDELPAISGDYSVRLLMDKVLQLQAIAKNMRQKRFDDGALRLDQVKLSFTLDKETGMPNGFYVYQQRDSNKLIEEFMLLANMAVAHKIYKTYPAEAVLRRHPPPQSRMMDDLVRTCRGLGIAMDISSSKSIHESIQQLAGETLEDRARAQILTVLCSKPMQNAKYFCTGMLEDEHEYHHYALNVPLYTHFTSPIRRYPDVMVHRLLAAALGYCKLPSTPKDSIQRQSDHSNDKKTNSKRAQELSSELFFAVFVKECGPLEERGMVMGVLDKSFDVLVLSLGVVKRVYCEKLPLRDFGFKKEQKKPLLKLIWNATDEHPAPVEQDLTIFSLVDCILTGDPEPLKFSAVIKHPHHSL